MNRAEALAAALQNHETIRSCLSLVYQL
uniref:Uncharacterized protein n=1 Tax=Rhizophora mucronata TaxID=61149 RepID=A0A2P2PEP5_RHIMU